MVDNDIWIGVFLVDASAAAREALGAHIGILGLKDAPDLAATTCIFSSEFFRERGEKHANYQGRGENTVVGRAVHR